ncbi:type I phosphodiesterase/nucleotide pyrophosphatase [Dysgonomonas alginatilytica]|uniref:Type I phosphodiesterase/nucleotide pyrophosphatase n=1 Tax=Dysgonomonas alginatilytica TaxID=1605892 RepID=A0A2V3PRW2_9BACT|nr:alkaline phosphatase [Dysgonomonas alginatilytica]PXV65115.1 type I phosphodiesterase/nucleotide pyrophosphatase [Dysgonomonas alginatilytica]
MKNRLLFLALFFIAFQINAANKAKHVVLIGCDGFGGYAFEKANIPNIKKLAQNGSMTLEMRTVLPSSSAVNWASILMGAGPTFHGYTEWGSKTPEIPSVTTSKYGKFPSIFTILREQKPNSKTALVYSWEGIEYLVEKDIINIVVPTKSNENLSADTAASIIIREKPDFIFIHFDEPDHVGHSIGHDTPEYYSTLEIVDQRVGKIIDSVNEAGIADETVIILLADHGGIDKGHGGKTLQEVQVPFIISGAGIKKNHKITDTAIVYDTAATIAKILGMKQPQAWRGIPLQDVFLK